MRTRAPARWSWNLGLATLVAAITVCVQLNHPALPRPLSLRLILAPGGDGASQPLVVTGRPGTADFLHVKLLGPDTMVFSYDHWGSPALESQPVHVVPGTPAPLEVDMPGVWDLEGSGDGSARLRVVYGEEVVFDQTVSSHPRTRAALYFAENPHPGTWSRTLAGELFRADGPRLQGSVSGYFNLGERLDAWREGARWQLLAVLLLSLCAARLGSRLREATIMRLRRLLRAVGTWPRHLVFLVTATTCTVIFALVVVHGSQDTVHPGYLRALYDHQAASLLEGRLSLPREAVHGEAFMFKDRAYSYFGIVPALMRVPFVLFDVEFGRLTDAFMIAEYFGCLLFAYLILGFAWSMVGGTHCRPRPWAVIVLLANLGLGSTLFFVSSRSFVYHEAVASALCFALGTAYYSLRYLAAPGQRWWIGALVCGTLSVHCRPPLGLFSLCLVVVTALIVVVRPLFAGGVGGRWFTRLPRHWPRHLFVGVLALLGILSFNGLSYLKFRTFDGAPLRYHEQYTGERLARFDGKSFHWSNMPLNASAYLLRPGWGLRPHFPYLITSAHQPGPGSKAKMDLAEPMLGLPFAMPGLFWLALGGLLGAFLWHRKLRPTVIVLMVGTLPMALAMFAAVASSQRYTADFLPFLFCAAALGAAMLEAARPFLRALGRGLAVALTGLAILITLALTLRYQGEMLWNVPDSVARDYRSWGRAADELLGFPPEAPPPATP